MKQIASLIVNWNQQDNTLRCLESLQKIQKRDFSLTNFLVDNNSSDNSRENVKRKFPETEILKSEKNLGFSGGVNFGIQQIADKNFDYILVLNNDILVEKDFLVNLFEFLENENSAAAASPLILTYPQKSIWFSGGKIIWPLNRTVHLTRLQNQEPVVSHFLSGCCLLIKTKVLKEIGLFDERYFLYYEDVDWSKRARNSGYSLWLVPQAKIYHKVAASTGGTASVFSVYYTIRNNLLFIQKFSKFPVNIFSYFYILILSLKIMISHPGLINSVINALGDFSNQKFGSKNP